MKQILIFIVSKLFRPFVKLYVSKPTSYRYEKIRIVVLPGVFHPRFFFSTRLLLKYLKQLSLKGKSFLELGAGSGLISLYAAQQGASVTACDISKISVQNVISNQALNHLSFPVIHSDLFSNIPPQQFDMVVINPPYYKKQPVSDADHAWYCGENSEYFTKLFTSISPFIHPQSRVIMVLSDVCDIPLIDSIAKAHKFDMQLLSNHQLLLEKNFIFQVNLQF